MSSKINFNQNSVLVAVSGGLDSIVLLHLLLSQLSGNNTPKSPLSNLIKCFVQQNNVTSLEVAYIDHAQRPDTNQDILAIKRLLAGTNFPLHINKLKIKQGSSENLTRTLRYKALDSIQRDFQLKHLITAHHADDVLETAIINLSRGTGPKGLSSLRHHHKGIWRPFLFKFEERNFITKQDLLSYAQQNNLTWHEDSTNLSLKFFRNRVRRMLATFPESKKQEFLNLIAKNQTNIIEIDLLTLVLTQQLKNELSSSFNKQSFLKLTPELKAHFIHHHLSLAGYDINRLAVIKAIEFIETATKGKTLQLKGLDVCINSKDAFSILPARQSIKKDE